ncbi:heat shock factor 2-binding protein-like isoform X2 [Dreissena polymorpha]|uniref:heat shock factor 2-binding protein-like isoform X2 n=1 Tax=Dreissena polymorpha TaxID=45954 RepID=UPI0022646B0B|nr:heat shock factor 2-binding protein-like isoform X2 [Dreissena polymorpha]
MKELHSVFSSQVLVSKNDLAQLATEVTQLKQTLPLVLSKRIADYQTRLSGLRDENDHLLEQISKLTSEKDQWKNKYETAVADTQAEKQESLRLRCEVQQLGEQLSRQSDYCASLGSSCCTLLWRVSKRDDCIQAILAGTKVDEFLSLVSSTLGSYVAAYRADWPKDSTEEAQFILALTGTITNIAASAYGRDVLCTNTMGRQVLDTFITVLTEAPCRKSAQLKNFVLMCLYNVSINQKGAALLEGKSGLVSLCAWLLQEESNSELRLNSLRLVQSLVWENKNPALVRELREVLPVSALETLSKDSYSDIRELALELLSDISRICTED